MGWGKSAAVRNMNALYTAAGIASTGSTAGATAIASVPLWTPSSMAIAVDWRLLSRAIRATGKLIVIASTLSVSAAAATSAKLSVTRSHSAITAPITTITKIGRGHV